MNIRQILQGEDPKGNFQELLRRGLINYAASGYEKWYWQYGENPFFSQPGMPAWICAMDGSVVGYLGAIPVKLNVKTRQITAAWAVDFMTLPECRGRGIGRALTQAANRHFDIFFSIGQTDRAAALFAKMGWALLGNIPYYVKILDSRPLLKKKVKNSFISNLAGIPVNGLLKLRDYLKINKPPNGVEISRVYNFSDEADRFWEEIQERFKIVVPRNRTYLNWKYDKQPHMNYVKFRATRENKILGYIVTRCIKAKSGNSEGLIVDFIAPPDDNTAIHSLIDAAVRYLKSENCSVIRCYVNNSDIGKALAGYGFIRRRFHMRFMVNKNIDGLEEIHKLDSWFITAGDCDIDR